MTSRAARSTSFDQAGGRRFAISSMQALALVKGSLGLAIVDQFATHGQDLIIRPLVEEMHAAYRKAQRLNRQINSASLPA